VLISPATAPTGVVNHEAIAAAKPGVEVLTRNAAATETPHGVRVNCVRSMIRTMRER
jgi:NAD(P)-dependent dehydrogenase (short-subunit alcohol dehydrogenase family)